MSASRISSLPKEISEVVFAQISLPELLLSHSRVCKIWKLVISSEGFLAQRKLFYRYKRDDGETRARLRKEVINSLRQIPDINGNLMGSEEQESSYLERCLPYLVTKFSDQQTLEILHLTEESLSAVCHHPR